MGNWGIDFKGWDSRDTIKKKAIEQRAIKRKINNEKVHFFKANELNKICPTPKTEEQYRVITEKQFNAFALIVHLLKDNIIEEMYLAIYRINQPTVDSIIEYIESGKIKKATFIISNYFNQTKKPEKWAIKLKDFCRQNKNSRHIYIHNHAKVLIVKTANQDYFVFEGSGNMSDNARIEQYIYENNKKIYDFHKSWMEELICQDQARK